MIYPSQVEWAILTIEARYNVTVTRDRHDETLFRFSQDKHSLTIVAASGLVEIARSIKAVEYTRAMQDENDRRRVQIDVACERRAMAATHG